MNKKEMEALEEVINYLWDDEQKNFVEEENPKHHIFNYIQVLDAYLNKHC